MLQRSHACYYIYIQNFLYKELTAASNGSSWAYEIGWGIQLHLFLDFYPFNSLGQQFKNFLAPWPTF